MLLVNRKGEHFNIYTVLRCKRIIDFKFIKVDDMKLGFSLLLVVNDCKLFVEGNQT